MNDRIYHLSSCNTCQRIIKGIPALDGFEIIDVKIEHIDAKSLDWLAKQSKSYESLFNRRSRKYRELKLHEENLSEEKYRYWILKEYTFLKRPIIIYKGKAFIGNARKTVDAAYQSIQDNENRK